MLKKTIIAPTVVALATINTLYAAQVPTVETTTLLTQTIEQSVQSYGTIVSPQAVTLRAQDAAEVISIDFKAGQTVKKGQTLFELQVSDLSNQPAMLKAQMEKSKSHYQRLLTLNKQVPGSVAAFDLLSAKSQYQQDLATYHESQKVQYIKAPTSGLISDTELAVGDIVSQAELLATITPTDNKQIKYQLPSNYVDQVKLGQAVSFYPSSQNKVFKAVVSYISPRLNASNGNIDLRANFINPADLKINQFGKVLQTVNPHFKKLAISQDLVMSDAQGFYVYGIEDHKVIKRYFNAGMVTAKGLIPILSGLKTGSKIISSNLRNISPGETVKVNP